MTSKTKRLGACALAMTLLAAGAHAQSAATDHGAMDHASMGHGAPAAPDAPPAPPPIGSLPSSDGAGERGYDSYGIHRT